MSEMYIGVVARFSRSARTNLNDNFNYRSRLSTSSNCSPGPTSTETLWC